MDRPIKMTGPSLIAGHVTIDHAKDVGYDAAGQVTSMKYLQWQDGGNGAVHYFTESKSFNTLYQLTRQTTTGTGGTAADLEYTFSPTANNGRISGRKNYVSGEDVVYSYDELNRLVTASIAGTGGWGQAFTYDGFGNLWSQAVTKGTAPSVTFHFDMATNRMSGSSWYYDANGNTHGMVVAGGTASAFHDSDNRINSWQRLYVGTEEYGYLADNKRVWKRAPDGVEYVFFYGAGGEKLLTFVVQSSPLALNHHTLNVYFGGKPIRADGVSVVLDRLGSVVVRSGCWICGTVDKLDYFPYGDEIGPATFGNVNKFGTYHHDHTSKLSYADQRYYSGYLGRFMTSDPYEASGGASEPGSWNRYAYVGGNPVNKRDPSGLACEWVSTGTDGKGNATGNWADVGAGGCSKAGVNSDGSIANSHIVNVQATFWGGSTFLANQSSLEVAPDMDQMFQGAMLITPVQTTGDQLMEQWQSDCEHSNDTAERRAQLTRQYIQQEFHEFVLQDLPRAITLGALMGGTSVGWAADAVTDGAGTFPGTVAGGIFGAIVGFNLAVTSQLLLLPAQIGYYQSFSLDQDIQKAIRDCVSSRMESHIRGTP